MNDADGIALTSVAHPKAVWYKRLWFWLRRPRLSPDSLETIEIEIREPSEGLRLGFGQLARVNYLGEGWVDDKEVEREIQAKGLTAPRVSLEDVEACIAYEWYALGSDAFTIPVFGPAHHSYGYSDITPLRCLTLCVLQLKNGFLVTGESVCVYVDNFDEAIGRKIARQKAIDKVWMLEGYLLREKLYRYASGTANSVP